MTFHQRARLYRVLLAASALAGLYGVASEQQLAAWAALVMAVFGTGTASYYTRSEP
jgi:hypothetical protein